jgi:hypothetical protein
MWFQNFWGISILTIAIRRSAEQSFDYDKCIDLRPITAGSLRHQYAEVVEELVRNELQKLKEDGAPKVSVGVEAPTVQVLDLPDGTGENDRMERFHLRNIL